MAKVKKDSFDKQVHDNPLGVGFAHKDKKDFLEENELDQE